MAGVLSTQIVLCPRFVEPTFYAPAETSEHCPQNRNGVVPDQGRELSTVSPDVADAGAAPPVDPREVTKRIMDGSEVLQQLIASNFGGEWVRSITN